MEYGSGFGFCRHRRFSGLNGGGSEESHAIPLGLVESTTTRERSLDTRVRLAYGFLQIPKLKSKISFWRERKKSWRHQAGCKNVVHS